jgi:hypothetical protein
VKTTRIILLITAAFASGVAFVVACGDGTSMIDAGRADAQGTVCAACEKPIDASRILYVQNRLSTVINAPGPVARESTAFCPESTVLMGGGCWVYNSTDSNYNDLYNGQHTPIAFGPYPQPPTGSQPDNNRAYSCVFENEEGHTDMIVVATAICLKLVP